MNRISIAKKVSVVAALVEGNSIRAIERMTRVAKHTILNLLRDLGCVCADYHHKHVRNVRVRRYAHGGCGDLPGGDGRAGLELGSQMDSARS